MNRLDKYRKQHADNVAAADLILAAAGEDGALTPEQTTTLADLTAKRAVLKASIDREAQQVADEAVARAVASSPGNGAPKAPKVEAPVGEKVFASLGDNLAAIVQAGTPTLSSDARQDAHNRLVAAASGASAGVGADGGFLIQKDFAVELMANGFESGELSKRCSPHEVGAGSDGLEVVYVDETSRATGSRWGGVQIYRAAEADTVTAKKPKLGKWEVRLEDIIGLAYLTERLMQDAVAMAGVFKEAFTDEFGFKLDDEIFRGSGTGECQGVISAPATVEQAIVTGQTADQVIADNVISMWARVLPRSKSSAAGAWFVNTALGPFLQKMFIPIGVGGQMIYMPAGGLTGLPHATLFGKPVIELEQASAPGDVGDICYLDLAQYKLIRKGGVAQDESIHVRFLYNERTLRWVARVNGAPKAKSPITPYKGSNTLSSFVTLGAR